jgi:hypothetical protein
MELADFVDLTDLPVFSNCQVKDAQEVYSWDNHEQLEYNPDADAGKKWRVVMRRDIEELLDELRDLDDDLDGSVRAQEIKNELAEIMSLDPAQANN